MKIMKSRKNSSSSKSSVCRGALLVIFTIFFLPAVLTAQQITGTVTDKNGESMVGVNVVIQGTSTGTITDIDGHFIVKSGNPKDVLVFSYLGYTKQVVAVGNKKTINVVMEENTRSLDELVVVGYGTQKKSDLTGSVVSVKADEMNAIPTTSVAEMLRGQAAGVVVTQNSARPGGGSDIIIRGAKSLTGGNAPLYIVDGVPVSNIDDYNSQDILSLEILKDAASEAIYGARASNGVILITTKKGNENKTTVDFSAYLGSQQLKRNFDFYSPEEYAQLVREANRNYPDGTYLGGNPVDGVYPGDASLFGSMYQNLINKNFTDWEKLGIKPALQQKYDLSVRSGSKNTKIAASVGYFNQKGMIAPADYERANVRFNVDHQLSKHFSITFNTNYTYSNRDVEDDTFSKFITEPSLLSPYDANGNLVAILENSKYSPLWNNANQTNNTKTGNLLLNGALEWEIFKGLKYRLNASMNSRNAEQGIYLNSVHEKGSTVGGQATIDITNYTDYVIENIFTYDKAFNPENKFDATLVQSADWRRTKDTQMQGSGFTSDELGYNFISSAAKSYPVLRTISPVNLLSYMGRLRYNLKEKYLFSLSARMDGSSVFGANNKWGVFPAASFGWRISEEKFLKDEAWLSNLKLRLSYGAVGNTAISPYQSQGLATSYTMQFGTGDPYIGYLPGSQLPNPNLKWETTTTSNAGVDISVLRDRLGATVEFYNAVTTNLLQLKSINQTTGYTSQLVNVGKVRNRGLEISVNAVPVKTKDFSWTVNVNFSTNKNKILALNGSSDDLTNKWFIGHNINAYYDYQFDHIMQKGETVTTYYASAPSPGDILVKDVDKNDTINDKDRVIMDRDPKWTGSLSSTISWKGFDLSFDVYTVQGTLRLNPFLYDANSGGNLSGLLTGIKVDYWTLENPSNTAPRPRSNGGINYFTSIAYQDASYIRLRNIALGYTFPKKLIGPLHINNLRVYCSATNAFTSTKFLSYSPEASASAYPEPMTLTVGLNASF
jgi:TonB-linked SusC/RagA family outer membrane protein